MSSPFQFPLKVRWLFRRTGANNYVEEEYRSARGLAPFRTTGAKTRYIVDLIQS